MHTLSRGGRAAANPVAGRSSSSQAFHALCHGKMALMLQHQAQRQALLVASAKKRYQDYDQDSLDSFDELDKFNKYADLIDDTDFMAGSAGTATTKNVTYSQQQQQQQVTPPPATRAPASFSDYNDDFGFDDSWSLPPVNSPNGGGGYYSNGGGGYGGGGYYSNGRGSGYGNAGGYSGGGQNFLDGWDMQNFGGGGYGGNFGGYGSYTGSFVNRQQKGSNRFKNSYDFEEEIDDIDGEMPVVKVDKCVINGKTLLCNQGITVKEVFLLGQGNDRNPLGVMSTSKAQELADEAKEDLLLINPEASPPVAKIIKWDKYKYEQEKATKEKKAKSVTTETKEVRMRPSTDSGDIETKLKSCKKFLTKGDRVKLVMKFEGREVQFKEQGKEVLLNFISELAAVAKVEGPLNFKTGTYTILLAPKAA